MNLHDEVLKEIEKGPQEIVSRTVSRYNTEFCRVEGQQEFATRIAELATKLEREACAELARCYANGGMEMAEAIEARGRKA